MLANWVKQAVTAGGAGNLTLGSADSGFIDLNTAIGQGLRFPYTIEDGGNRETGIGYLSTSTTLVREAILETLVSGAYDNTSPAALNVTTAAKVMISAVASQMTRYPGSIALDYDNLGYVSDALGGGNSTLGLVANRLVVSSFFLPCRVEASGMGMSVTTGAAGNAMLGLYLSTSRSSAMLLAQIAAANQIDTTSTGDKTASFSSPIVLNPGFYLTAMHVSAAPTIRTNSATQPGQMSISLGATTNFGGRYSQSYTYGTTMPATLSSANFSTTVASSPRVVLMGN